MKMQGRTVAYKKFHCSHERCDAALTGKRAAVRGGRTEVEKYHTELMILSFIISWLKVKTNILILEFVQGQIYPKVY